LLLAYHFPPIGGAGAQRNTKLARYLPQLGYEVTVLTGPGSPDYRWAPLDETMAAQIDHGVRIERLSAPEPDRGSRWRERAERWLLAPSAWQRWWDRLAVDRALAVGRDTDVVYASLAPFGIAASAHAISRRLQKPLVVDLEDPWALDEMMVYPSRVHRHVELRRMRHALRLADAIVMNTPEAAERVRFAFPELASVPIVAIPNGFDRADFAGAAPMKDGHFRIVHTGTLHTDLGLRHRKVGRLRRVLGGAVPGVDLLTRSHVYLLEAVERLLRDRPELSGRLEVHLVGSLTPADRRVNADNPLVREHGFLDHAATIELIRSASLLFLPMHDLPPGRRVTIVPCKTYEYLGSGRPILAAVPDGDARDLLFEAGNAYVCRPSDVAAMRTAIEAEMGRSETMQALPPPPAELLERLERAHLTGELADFLERVATRSGQRSSAAPASGAFPRGRRTPKISRDG
jgi:glycosyltransferase involved in cell wall biosynthesis